jgi:hypothetical protein
MVVYFVELEAFCGIGFHVALLAARSYGVYLDKMGLD